MRIAWLLCSLLVASFVAAPAAAQVLDSIKGPVRILVGFAPGGTTDLVARLLAERLRDAIGHAVVVENRAGAGGRIAAEALKNAAPDGTTLLLVPIFVPVLAPLVSRELYYDPARDLAPVTHVANYQSALVVAASHPATTVPEFVAWVKSHGGQASFGTPAAGSLQHFLGLIVGKASGIEMTHVAYKGIAPLALDLAGGHIPAGASALSDLLDLHRAGKLRIIATSGAKRSPLLPAVPTFKEQGLPEIEANGWIAFYAPAKTPRPVIQGLSAAIVKVVRTPEVAERLVHLGLEPTGTTPEDLAAIMAADTARWAPIVKSSGFTAD